MLSDGEFDTTIRHAMEMWFEPEIRRRQEAGTAPTPCPIRSAQVIVHADGRPNEIRLNEEVRAHGRVRLKTGVRKDVGDPITLDEIAEFPTIELPDTEDPNCGHLTVFQFGQHTLLSFDFRYNKGRSTELLNAAEEFLATAVEAVAAQRDRVAVDTLFSAAELAATAFVLATPIDGKSDGYSHGWVESQFNLLTRDGNVESDQRTAFNELRKHRPRSRYLKGPPPSTETMRGWQASVKGLIAATRARIAPVLE